MSIKDDIHELVDRLNDTRAPEVLAYLRRLVDTESPSGHSARARLGQRMGPTLVSGQAFMTHEYPTDPAGLATRQGVRPVTNFDDLLGDFWPDDETADDFIATIRRWRREGGHA